MTNDYKNVLFDYITGGLEVGTQQDNTFRDNEMIVNNLKSKLSALGITSTTLFQTLTTTTTSNYLIYGGYTSGTKMYGFIAILNQSGEVLDIITEYDSGTKLGYFQVLNYDENGNIYGLDFWNNRDRFIMLNNVAVKSPKGFICKLRQSYYIPTSPYFSSPLDFLAGTCFIKKAQGEAVYYMFGDTGGTTSNSYLVKFTINVGTENEWEYFTGASISTGAINFCDFILEQNGSTTTAYIYYTITNSGNHLYCDYFNGTTLTRQSDTEFTNLIIDLRILDQDTVYVSTREYVADYNFNIQLYEYDSGTKNLIKQYNNLPLYYPRFYLNLINGMLFTKLSGGTNTNTFQAICGVYDRINYIESEILETELTDYVNTACTVQQIYSLYKFVVQFGSTLYRPSIVIYDNQYSGSSYIDYNSLIPLHAELYSSGYIIFARSLYNKQVYQNMCIATINVPNNFLNDISIQPSNLLGITMTELVNNTNAIQKNIYENLFINFNNKIQVIDEDTNTLYPETAIWINNNVSYGSQILYEGGLLNKIRINFEDNTSTTQEIYWTDYDTYRQTEFTLYVSQPISSIEFINSNEDFTYISKQYDLEVGKTYTITQKIRID